MTLAKKPWNWDKATLAFRKHHEHGQPRRYRHTSLRRLKAAHKVAESGLRSMPVSRLVRTIQMMEFRARMEEADASIYGHP